MNNSIPYKLGWGNGFICISGPDNLLKDLLRIPGAAKAEWGVAVPESRAAFMACEALAAPTQISAGYREARARMMSLAKDAVDWAFTSLLMGAKLATPLLPHQLNTVAFIHMLQGKGCLIAHQPGVGKTRCALASAYLWRAQRVLVVCPLSVIPTWKREWELLWLPPRPFAMSALDAVSVQERRTRLIAHGVTPAAWPLISCVNYEVIADLADAVKEYNPDVVILDEASRCKNEKAKVTQSLIPICDKAKHVLLLNGTPFANRGAADLWAQLRMLGKEVVPESFWQFASAYCNLDLLEVGGRQLWQPSGCRDPIGLMQRLEPYYFRVTREAIMTLPPTRRITVELEMTKEQRTLYDAVEKDGAGVLGNPLSLDGARVIDIRLHQIAGGHRPEYAPEDAESSAAEYKLIPFPNNPKTKWLQQFTIDNLFDNPSVRMVVWCRYLKELNTCLEYIGDVIGSGRVAAIWGETSNENIEQLKQSFNSLDPEGVRVLICQTAKMAFGHNLPGCSVMVYYSNDWSHLLRIQSEDRARRIGSEGGLTIYDLCCRDSIDGRILAALQSHQDFSERMAPQTAGRIEEH